MPVPLAAAVLIAPVLPRRTSLVRTRRVVSCYESTESCYAKYYGYVEPMYDFGFWVLFSIKSSLALPKMYCVLNALVKVDFPV